METLEAANIGPSLLTLQEALSTLDISNEGTLFHLKLKPSSDSNKSESFERILNIRFSEVSLEGEKRIILLISDLTDSVNYNKMKL
jgi:hypothetical protein